MNVFLGIAALRIGQNNENFTIEATKFYNPSVNAVIPDAACPGGQRRSHIESKARHAIPPRV